MCVWVHLLSGCDTRCGVCSQRSFIPNVSCMAIDGSRRKLNYRCKGTSAHALAENCIDRATLWTQIFSPTFCRTPLNLIQSVWSAVVASTMNCTSLMRWIWFICLKRDATSYTPCMLHTGGSDSVNFSKCDIAMISKFKVKVETVPFCSMFRCGSNL